MTKSGLIFITAAAVSACIINAGLGDWSLHKMALAGVFWAAAVVCQRLAPA
jgi:hypothetical protein